MGPHGRLVIRFNAFDFAIGLSDFTLIDRVVPRVFAGLLFRAIVANDLLVYLALHADNPTSFFCLCHLSHARPGASVGYLQGRPGGHGMKLMLPDCTVVLAPMRVDAAL